MTLSSGNTDLQHTASLLGGDGNGWDVPSEWCCQMVLVNSLQGTFHQITTPDLIILYCNYYNNTLNL